MRSAAARVVALSASSLRRGLAGARRRAGATAWAVAAIGAVLFAIGATRVVDRTARDLTDRWPRDVDLVVYLDDAVTAERTAAIADTLRRLPAVERVEPVPPAEALAHLRASLGPHGELVDDVEPGLLPASLEVALAPGIEDVAATHPVIERLRRTAGVDDVEFLGDFHDRSAHVAGGLRRAGGAATALALGLGGLLVLAVVRLAVAGRRPEAALLELLGAGVGFRRGSALVHGLLVGLGGGALAGLALSAAHRRLGEPLAAALGALDGAAIARLPLAELAALIGFGGVVGAVGGLVAIAAREAGLRA